jgi:prevent-host-death family protein
MKKAGIREVRQNLSALIEEVRKGHEITITDRGKPVAILIPPPPAGTRPFAGRSAFRKKMPKLKETSRRESSMAAKSESEGLGIYVDSSAFAKLYVPEPGSARLDRLLRGRTDLMTSERSVTELISAVARRRREGVLDARHASAIRDAVLSDARSGSFRVLDLSPSVHREAERMLLHAFGTAPNIGRPAHCAGPIV